MSGRIRRSLGILSSQYPDFTGEAAVREPPTIGAGEGRGGLDEATAIRSAGWERISTYVYRKIETTEMPGKAQEIHRLLPEGVDIGQCLFFDTETTGLSGAGTVIFLFGMGHVVGDIAELEQVFLADFPGESEFLGYLEGRMSRFTTLVSYNGKSFDTNLLRSRFILNGRTMSSMHQIDLLYLARRLWRHMTVDCRLSTIERQILGIDRGADTPGWEVPGIYFDFLRTGNYGRLQEVFDHNRHDVVSLIRLFHTIEELMGGGLHVPVDRASLGEYLLQFSDPTGLTHLREAYHSGNIRAGVVLSMSYKRAQKWTESVAIWRSMAENHRSVFAAIELAKYYEHKRRDSVDPNSGFRRACGDFNTACPDL